MTVSNSHNSPKGYPTNWGGYGDKNGTPKGYPGWQGIWEGEVEVLDGCKIAKKGLYFSGLTGAWSDSVMNIWYIQTGTGGGGEKFRYDGMIWLYDFPKMNTAFEESGGRLKALDARYINLLEEYKKEYENARDMAIKQNLKIQKYQKLKEKLTAYTTQLDHYQEQLKKHIVQKFNDTYNVPLPQSIYTLSASEVLAKQVQLSAGQQATAPEPSLNNLYENIEKVVKEIDDYVKAHPEILFCL